jgi:hypothetical protein
LLLYRTPSARLVPKVFLGYSFLLLRNSEELRVSIVEEEPVEIPPKL